MSSEYVKLSRPEITYAQKNLLQSQIEILDILKNYRIYQKLRQEELLLKVALKNKIEDVKNNIIFLERLLPRAHLPKEEKKTTESNILREEDLSLEQEIDIIKQKIWQKK